MTSPNSFNRFLSNVRYYIYERMQEERAAEEVINEFYLRIHLELPALKQTQKLENWLVQLLNGIAVEYHQQNNQQYNVTDCPELGNEAVVAIRNCMIPLVEEVGNTNEEELQALFKQYCTQNSDACGKPYHTGNWMSDVERWLE